MLLGYCTYEAAFAARWRIRTSRWSGTGSWSIVDRGKAAGLMCALANDVHYPLDYGTVMPVVCYLDRTQTIPVVPVSVCLASDLDEAFAWGRLIVDAVGATGRRAAFAASGSVSHKLVRGPERWPSAPDQDLDRRFARMLADGDYEKAWGWLPSYAEAAEPEMGGRHLAMMLGAPAAGITVPPSTPMARRPAAATTSCPSPPPGRISLAETGFHAGETRCNLVAP